MEKLEIIIHKLSNAISKMDNELALLLIHDYEPVFLDPYLGVYLHAEVLFSAIRHNSLPVVQALLKLPVHSDVAFFKFCGLTPISAALEEHHDDLIPILLTRTDLRFALDIAVRLKQQSTVKFLLAHGKYKAQFLSYLGIAPEVI